jgi:talin
MGVLSLKVRLADRGIVKTMQFDPSTLVYDACAIIREKIPDACPDGQGQTTFVLLGLRL